MLIDAEALEDGAIIEGRFVIVGGGIAGLALARQLADVGHEVTILESGGEAPEPRVQALYAGHASLGAPGNATRDVSDFLISSRQRCLGGSGNVWGGKCAPLDELDFESRAWVPHSGWPVTRRQLMPYYDRACELLELPKFDAPESPVGQLRESVLAEKSKLFTPRPRCYTRYTGAAPGPHYPEFKRLAASHPRIRIYLRANVTHIQLDRDGQQCVSLAVQCLNGRRHQARGGTYILATGGIENARLLLASNDVQRTGIGDHSDWLGRGFLVHTTIARSPGTALSLMRKPADLASYDIGARDRPHVVIGSSNLSQSQTRTGNFTATIAGNPRGSNAAAMAVQAIAQRVLSAEAATAQSVYFMVEQTPNRESRMTLSAQERDELGMSRVQLNLHYSDLSLDTLGKSVSRLGSELGRLEAGRLQWDTPRHEVVENMYLSRHHMGATRMAHSRRDGVVDENCRVHGMKNLYIAGSSVFPTSGIANPTLTLLALGFRLGDHLIQRTPGRV